MILLSSPAPELIQLDTPPADYEIVHEYEDVDQIPAQPPTMLEGSKFSVSVCPAYSPSTRSAHLDTECEIQEQGQGSTYTYEDMSGHKPVQQPLKS